jgi:aminoglycoside phosphotransferase (APT) family kinase protein
MERRYPLIEIDLTVAATLLEPLVGASRPQTLQLLTGGHINTNYAVTLENGRRLVLRIFVQGDAALRNETRAFRVVAGSVPIPRMYLEVCAPQSFAYPYTVLEWIEGVPLNMVLERYREAALPLGQAVAATLLAIRKQEFSGHTFLPFVEYIRSCLFERGAAQYLGRELTARLWTLVQEQGPWLRELCQEQTLVHGDFQGDNILVRKDIGGWRIAAVLDWEWANCGCWLRDMGSLLRFEAESRATFQRGLEAGFSALGETLPCEWDRASRTFDLAALCEKLAYPRHRGEVTVRSIRTIERCLQDYAR